MSAISLLFATKILEEKEGGWTYADVPDMWADEVKKILISEGRRDLVK